MNQKPSVLIIASQEQIRDSLQVLQGAIPEIGSVELASVVSPGLAEKSDNRPALILMAPDSSYSDAETLLTLHQIKSAWPGVLIAVLVENERQYQAVKSAGADSVLFNGLLASEILKKIEWLLARLDSQDLV